MAIVTMEPKHRCMWLLSGVNCGKFEMRFWVTGRFFKRLRYLEYQVDSRTVYFLTVGVCVFDCFFLLRNDLRVSDNFSRMI